MRISDWSSDVCSSDLFTIAIDTEFRQHAAHAAAQLLAAGVAIRLIGIVQLVGRLRIDVVFAAAAALAILGGNDKHHRATHVRRQRLGIVQRIRSEEPTSELQSLMRNSYAVFCLKQK